LILSFIESRFFLVAVVFVEHRKLAVLDLIAPREPSIIPKGILKKSMNSNGGGFNIFPGCYLF